MTVVVTGYDDQLPKGQYEHQQSISPEQHQQSFAEPQASQQWPASQEERIASDNPPEYSVEPGLARRPTLGQRLHQLSSKAGAPLNKASNILGAEGWWPASLERESLKAARILYSFTNLNVATTPPPSKAGGPKHPIGLTKKKFVKIPVEVLRNCAGLAIFNTIRAGVWHGSLSGGSGVVVARHPDGTWSPPSSFLVSSLGAGFMFGFDVYDCICVLNTPEQVDAFTKPRVALGGGASIALGPVGGGASLASALSKSGRPMWSYIKSRGLWAGISIDGTVMVNRSDANSLFYQEKDISAQRILRGDVAWPVGAKPLFEILKAIEGRGDIDSRVVEEVVSEPAPGDVVAAPPADYVDARAEFPDEKGSVSHGSEARKGEDLYESSVVDEKEALARAGV
jgi:lipid-binding SYLF domain-containing protein